jgi:hypothetical protein
MPHGEQFLGKMRPDKAGTACDQDSHGAKLATDGHGWTQIFKAPFHTSGCSHRPVAGHVRIRSVVDGPQGRGYRRRNLKVAPVQQQINPV